MHTARYECQFFVRARVVLSSFCCWFVGSSSILLILDVTWYINDDISNTTVARASTVDAFCSHISLFLLSFHWILFLSHSLIQVKCVRDKRAR